MMDTLAASASATAIDWQPLGRLLMVGASLALLPLVVLALRQRGRSPAQRLRALAALTLFLCFDLVLFGAFTRLTDSGLGCPDWPGCYGQASPQGAQAQISAAQAAQPTGPVTHGKAWVEMVHRYLATAVGALITVMAGMSLWWRRSAPARHATPPAERVAVGLPLFTLAWVCLQGAFGAWTVTLKLYPAVVTAHLMGGIVLLVLLAAQHEGAAARPLHLTPGLRALGLCAALALALQILLGGWVSTNYAVLACADFPTCRGQWWPEGLVFSDAYTLRRPLGRSADGGFLPAGALVAIHLTHRLWALATAGLLALLALGLWRQGGPRASRHARALALLLALQLATGIGNVVLGWPLLAAVLHTGGAAGLAIVLTRLAMQARPVLASRERPRPTVAVAS